MERKPCLLHAGFPLNGLSSCWKSRAVGACAQRCDGVTISSATQRATPSG
jgi:hypothetical protein